MKTRTPFRSIFTFVAAIIALLLAPARLGAAPPLREEQLAKIDSIIQRGVTEKDYPGAVFVVGKGSDTITRAYGHHTYEPGSAPMTSDTVFDLASVTKVVGTATAAMALYEDQRLDLD